MLGLELLPMEACGKGGCAAIFARVSAIRCHFPYHFGTTHQPLVMMAKQKNATLPTSVNWLINLSHVGVD